MTEEENKDLSKKAKENLRRNDESREKSSKFIKLQHNEKRILKFDPEKIEQRETDFNGKGRKTTRYVYAVIEPNTCDDCNFSFKLFHGHGLLLLL